MNLYKKLSTSKQDVEIINFKKELTDRFGKIPKETIELINSIHLRSLAEKINCEKIVSGSAVLKSNKPIIEIMKLQTVSRYEVV